MVTSLARVKIPYEGTTEDADELEFRVVSEALGSYELGDGGKVELRHEVHRVYKLCDKKKEDGSPIYVLTGAALLTSIPPATGSSS